MKGNGTAGRPRPATPAQTDAHESHRGFPSGPAQSALRARVEADRRRFPQVLRNLLWTTLALIGLCVGLSVFLAVVDGPVLVIIAKMLGLSFFVGREAAMLYAYSHDPAIGPAWILLAAVLDDFITLGLTLPIIWFGIERLRGAHVVGGIMLSLETTAMERRGFLRRWGLYGLLAFVWIPGIGAGVFLAGTMGLVSKIPMRRLIIALALGSLAVNVFWAIGLYYTSSLIPREGIWSYIPLAVVTVLGIAALGFGLLQRRKRDLFPIIKVQTLGKEHVARLLEVGITDGMDLLYVNRRTLASKLGLDPAVLGGLRSVAELCMVRTVSPRHAEMLAEVGIASIRDLAVAPPDLIAAALKELESRHTVQPRPGQVERFEAPCRLWTQDARVFLAEGAA